jgi:hypothetical protein
MIAVGDLPSGTTFSCAPPRGVGGARLQFRCAPLDRGVALRPLSSHGVPRRATSPLMHSYGSSPLLTTVPPFCLPCCLHILPMICYIAQQRLTEGDRPGQASRRKIQRILRILSSVDVLRGSNSRWGRNARNSSSGCRRGCPRGCPATAVTLAAVAAALAFAQKI